MDVVNIIEQVRKHYGEELARLHDKRTSESNRIWSELRRNNSEDEALKLYNSDKNIVCSRAWFEANPNSYQTIDIQGFDNLVNGFIIGVIDRNEVERLLQKHLTQ